MNRFLTILGFVAAIYFIATPAQSTRYWADITNGNNANDGLTLATAKKNAQNAVNLATTAGDQVWITNGWYPERIAFAASGTVAAPIVIVGIGHTNVACQGFDATGGQDNIIVVGIEITHLTEVGYAAVDSISSTNTTWDCMYVHSVDTGGNGSIQADRSHRMRWRNSIVAYTESAGTTNGTTPQTANYRSFCFDRGPNEYMVVEFCHIYQVGDYFNPKGTNMIFQGITAGPTTPDFASGAPHVDLLQCDGVSHYIRVRNIFGATNAVHDGHFVLIQNNGDGIRSGNISCTDVSWINNGDQLFTEMTDGTNLLFSHIMCYKAGTGPGWGGPASSGFIRQNDGPNDGNGKFINSVFTNGTTGQIFVLDGTGGAEMFIDRSNNCAWSVASDFTDGVNGNKKQDPKFQNATIGDFRLRSDSPCVDTGIHETWVTTSSGTGTSFSVDNSAWFTDGFGMTRGDIITVGNDTGLEITAITRSTHTITVNRSFTWAQNDPVSFDYSGSAPDMGPYDYGNDTFLSSAIYQTSGSDIIVTATGRAFQCTAYTNWVPMQTIYGTGPYTFAGISSISTVKFIVNPAIPQYAPFVTATFEGTAAGGGSATTGAKPRTRSGVIP